ncbi:MAG: enoyl-CoA hydratase/isomerase family protein [Myxococcales bacterium]|nr:enoyl-CoA hydratase/isomerase family protein [Myxococcales bacterium]MCB9521474.1 enoyl-CoA hydratase/isomerase family protein [Myxococcales bacterium]MCB9531756.1 enoyl-CoA hydratase/isomerase family protein [Myxococcales bacterium]
MAYDIRKVAVLGSGVMGSGIAAQLTNAGIPCLLLDIVPPNPKPGDDVTSKAFRNSFSSGAIAKFAKQKPAPLMSKRALEILEVGNFDDDMGRLAEVDWVIEVVVENLAIKQKVFANVEANIRPGTIVTSNTSGLSIKGMTEGRGDDFKRHFLVTHFFNPVRYMKLLELVEGEDTDPAVTAAVHAFGEETLGKGIVYGKDTTNFIANRIGVYGMMKTIEEMRRAELTVEEVDKIFGPAMGRPSSAIFRTGDLVGLDTFLHVAKNCYDTLVHDEEREVFRAPDFLEAMVQRGMLGDKSGGGFYKKAKGADGGKAILSLSLDTLEYVEQKKVRFDSLGAVRSVDDVRKRVAMMLDADDTAAKFAKKVTLDVLAYASRRIPEIADDVVNVDRGMRWGFGWDIGPFETWDAIGVEKGLAMMAELGIEPAAWVKEMVAAGRTSFYGVDGAADTFWDIPSRASKVAPESRRNLRVEHLKRTGGKVKENFGATLWDMGDDVLLVEFHTKMNAIDDDIIAMLDAAVDEAEANYKGIVIGNDATPAFSAGANIMALLMGARGGQWDMIRKMVGDFQRVNQRLRYSKIPVVTAPGGLALGGGAEVTMAGNAVQAKSELYMGLVEVGVGLIPGGGGNLQMLRNVYGSYALDPDFDPFPFIKKVFLSIGMAKVVTSAEEAKEAGFLNPTDGISMNGDFALFDAKQRALGMYEAGFRPPRPSRFLLPGTHGRATIDMMLYDMQLNNQISDYDRHIGSKLAGVLTGGDCSPTVPVTEERLLEIELEAFLSLCGEERTHARLEAMLTTGKPLRN